MSTQAIGNTGVSTGSKVFKRIVKGFLVQTFADDGTRNELDFSATTSLTKVAFDALVEHADPSKRWYPLPKFYDVEALKGDPVLDTAGDGTNFFIQDGIRSFNSIHKQQDATLIKALDTLECAANADWSIVLADDCDQLFVEEVEANKGRPLKIAESTFRAIYQFATDTTTNSIPIQYDFDKFIKDSRLTVVDVDTDADILNASGLITVRAAYTTISTTGATGTMTFDFGALGAKQAYEGAVTADFDLNEITPTPGPVTAFAVSEGLPGVYAMTWTLETTGDVLELTSTAAGLGNGFEVEADSQFTIP